MLVQQGLIYTAAGTEWPLKVSRRDREDLTDPAEDQAVPSYNVIEAVREAQQ